MHQKKKKKKLQEQNSKNQDHPHKESRLPEHNILKLIKRETYSISGFKQQPGNKLYPFPLEKTTTLQI